MKLGTALLCLIAITACMSADERSLQQTGIPAEVLALLPEGIDEQAVGLEGGCYLYDDAAGNPVFVTDASGQRICVN